MRACKARRKEWAAEAAAGSRGPQGPGRRGQQAFLGTEGSTPHSTLPGSRAPDGLSPTRGRRSPGLGRALAHAHSLPPPAPTPPRPLFPPQALRTVDVVGSFLPCRREKWQSGLCSHPHRDGPHSHQNVVALHFQTRPSIGPPFTLPLGTVLLCTV